MPERRKYDAEFRDGAVTIVRETSARPPDSLGQPRTAVPRCRVVSVDTATRQTDAAPPRRSHDTSLTMPPHPVSETGFGPGSRRTGSVALGVTHG
jgi:hypothetical protein